MELLKEDQASVMAGVPRSTLRRYVATGKFPTPIKYDGWHVGWRREDVTAWLLSRAVVEDVGALDAAAPDDLQALFEACPDELAARLFPRSVAVGGA